MNKKKILVGGAGSIGIYLGTLLKSKGHDVTLFGRKKLSSIGDNIIIKHKNFPTPQKIFRLPDKEYFDYIFVTTKLYDLDNMMYLLKKHSIKASLIITIQNGLVDTAYYSRITNCKVIPVSIFAGYRLVKNEIVTNETKLGWRVEKSREGIKALKIIKNAGIPCYTDQKFDSIRAEKVIVNCCVNALSAIKQKPIKYLFGHKSTQKVIDKVLEESFNVLSKEHKLDNLKLIKQRLYKHWSNINHYSSTYQDLVSGRKTEINFFNGYVQKLGKKYNIPVEENKSIVKELKRVAESYKA